MSDYEQPKREEILPRPVSETRHGEVPRRHPRSLFWPVFLMGMGTVMLLSNLGIFPASGWAVLWRMWPLTLIGLGLDVLLGRRSTLGAILVSGLFLVLIGGAIGVAFFAQHIPALIQFTQSGGYQHEYAWHPADGLESARVAIQWTNAPGRLLALEDSSHLIEANVDYQGQLRFDVLREEDHADVQLESDQPRLSFGGETRDARWNVGLNPRVALDLHLDTGTGACDFDLTGLALTALALDVGPGAVAVTLPTASFAGAIDGGPGALSLRVPQDVGLRVTLARGSGAFHPGHRLTRVSGDADGVSVWETPDYAASPYQIALSIDQSVGALHITDD